MSGSVLWDSGSGQRDACSVARVRLETLTEWKFRSLPRGCSRLLAHKDCSQDVTIACKRHPYSFNGKKNNNKKNKNKPWANCTKTHKRLKGTLFNWTKRDKMREFSRKSSFSYFPILQFLVCGLTHLTANIIVIENPTNIPEWSWYTDLFSFWYITVESGSTDALI